MEEFIPYVNIIVARIEDKDNPIYQQVVAAYQQQNDYDFIVDHYEGAIISVFEVKD